MNNQPKWRLISFRLSTLLLMTAVVSLATAWSIDHRELQKKLIEADAQRKIDTNEIASLKSRTSLLEKVVQQRLKEISETALRVELERALQKVGPKHPDILRIQGDLSALESIRRDQTLDDDQPEM